MPEYTKRRNTIFALFRHNHVPNLSAGELHVVELLEVVLPGLLRVVDMLAERTLEINDHVL